MVALAEQARDGAREAPGAVRGLPPGPRAPVALQTLLAWSPWGDEMLARLRRRYGDVFTIRIEPTGTMVFLADLDAVREVFTGSPELLHAGEGNGVLRPVVGERSVLTSDGEAHLQRRRLMLPLFHGEAVRGYEEIVREVCAAEVASWPRERAFRLHGRMRALTFDVIARAVFGVAEGDELDRFRATIPPLVDIGLLDLWLWEWPSLGRFWPWRRYAARQTAADALLRAEVAARRRDPRLDERRDILSLLLGARDSEGVGLEDEDVRDQLATLLLAGHETTATELAWAFECLLRNPDVHDRAIAAARAHDDRYLDAVVQETLRLRPVITAVARQLTAPATVAGHHLPAGVVVAPAIGLIHASAKLYREPERFRPERFLSEGETPPSYGWIPFGGGIRRCLGAAFASMEMRIVLGEVLRRVRLEAADRRPERPRTRHITSIPGRGVRVRVGAQVI